MTKLTAVIAIYSLMFTNFAFAKNAKFNLKEFALPSEVKGMQKSYGSVFFSPSVKDTVLIPVHFWGEVKKSGLHFLPVNTTVVNGLSIAGGPSASASLEDVKLTRKSDEGRLKVIQYNLSEGGNENVYTETFKPGDSVFIGKSHYYENRAYYTSLIGVIATILSSVLVIQQIND